MTRLVRWPLLVAALVSFTLEVATVANLRCDMMEAAQSPGQVPDHAGHGGHHSPTPTSGHHQAGSCICIAGCALGLGLGAPVVAGLTEPQLATRVVDSVPPTPPLPLVAQPFALPLSHAPPVFA